MLNFVDNKIDHLSLCEHVRLCTSEAKVEYLSQSLHLIFWGSVSLNLEFNKAWLTGQWAPVIHLSPICRLVSSLYWLFCSAEAFKFMQSHLSILELFLVSEVPFRRDYCLCLYLEVFYLCFLLAVSESETLRVLVLLNWFLYKVKDRNLISVLRMGNSIFFFPALLKCLSSYAFDAFVKD